MTADIRFLVHVLWKALVFGVFKQVCRIQQEQQDINSSHRKLIDSGTNSNPQLQTYQPGLSSSLEMTSVGPTKTNVPGIVSVGQNQLEHASHSVFNAGCRPAELGNMRVLQASSQSPQHATYQIRYYSGWSVSYQSAERQDLLIADKNGESIIIFL